MNTDLANMNLDTSMPQDSNLYDMILVKYANKDFIAKFINVCLYQSDFSAVSGINNNSQIIKYFKGFLTQLTDDVRNTSSFSIQQKPIISSINLVKKILDVKDENTARLVTYDSVGHHFNTVDMFSSKILEYVQTNRISDFQKYKNELNELIASIEVYNELKKVKILFSEMDYLRQQSQNPSTSPLNFIKDYRNHIQNAYLQIGSLKNLTKDNNDDNYVEFYDETCNDQIQTKLFSFFSTKYSFYKTNYPIFDDNLEGLESGAVTIISAASNNGKSLLMMNILRNVVINPKNTFEPNEMILFITLEDDIFKVYRRFLSIFGNINTKITKQFFVQCAHLIQENKDIDIKLKTIEQEIKHLTSFITNKAIHEHTKGRCRIGILQPKEPGFNMTKAERMIDTLKAEGKIVKALFIDYIDHMTTNDISLKDKDGSNYVSHGQIVNDMKDCARNYGIPVLTVTQNGKQSENLMQSLDNSHIGDSYQKIRFADNILMLRQETQKNIMTKEVADQVFPKDFDMSKLISSDYHGSLVPMTIKVTKAKEGTKNVDKYHIFNSLNLRIAHSFEEVYEDMKTYKSLNDDFLNEIHAIGLSNISESLIFESDSDDELDNLVV